MADLQALLASALDLVPVGEAEVIYQGHDLALTRFAGNRIHQSVAEHDATLRLRVVDAGRTGVASTNRLDADGLRDVAARAVEICRRAAARPDPAPLADPLPSPAPTELGWVEETASADPELRATGARDVIEAGCAADLEVSGAFSTEASHLAIANSRGVWHEQRATQAKLLTVMMGDDGRSGYAQATGPDVRTIVPRDIGLEAADKAARSAGPVDLEPGEYPVVLEEYAVQVVLEYLSAFGFSALAVEEGRSFMELGDKLMSDEVDIWDDGLDPTGLPASVDFEGIPKQRVDLIAGGVARGVVHDGATAARAGVPSTGHGFPAPNPWGPVAWNLFMAPGTADRASLSDGIQRGIWVTRFHYVNVVHQRQAVLTGMTRDGTFLIENGELTRPLRNLRFTQAIPEAFSSVEAIGRETKLVAAEYSGINARVPAVRLGRFTFTGGTDGQAAG